MEDMPIGSELAQMVGEIEASPTRIADHFGVRGDQYDSRGRLLDEYDPWDSAQDDTDWLAARTCGHCRNTFFAPEMHQTGESSWDEREPEELPIFYLRDEDGEHVGVRLCMACHTALDAQAGEVPS